MTGSEEDSLPVKEKMLIFDFLGVAPRFWGIYFWLLQMEQGEIF